VLWHEWQQFGEHNATSLAATTFQNSVYLFATDATHGSGTTSDDKLFMRRTTPGTPFTSDTDTGWILFPAGGTTDRNVGPAVIEDKLYVFAKGVDDAGIYLSTTTDGTKWSPWEALPIGGTTFTRPAPVVFDNTLYLFVRDPQTGNAIYVTSTGDGKQWGPWSSPFPPLNLAPVVTDLTDPTDPDIFVGKVGADVIPAVHHDELFLFAFDNDWSIHVSSTTDGTKWSNWIPLDGVGIGLLAATSFSGGLCVFSVGQDDGRLYMKGSPDGVEWKDPWTDLGAPGQTFVSRGKTYPPYAYNPAVVGGPWAITLYVLGRGAIFSRKAVIEVDAPPDY
jgi:hypothetical protein